MPHTYNEAATSSRDVERRIKSKDGFEVWHGVSMGEHEKVHGLFKKLAKRMRKAGLRARVVTIAEGTIGMTGSGANMVKRTVIIWPEAQCDRWRDDEVVAGWLHICELAEKRYW